MGYSMPLNIGAADSTVQTVYLPFGKAANRIVLTNTCTKIVYFWPASYPTLSLGSGSFTSLTADPILDSGTCSGKTLVAAGDGKFELSSITAIDYMDQGYLYDETAAKYYKIQSVSLSTTTATIRLVGNPCPVIASHTFAVVLMKPEFCSLSTWLDNVPMAWRSNGWCFCGAAGAAWTAEGTLICESK